MSGYIGNVKLYWQGDDNLAPKGSEFNLIANIDDQLILVEFEGFYSVQLITFFRCELSESAYDVIYETSKALVAVHCRPRISARMRNTHLKTK